MSVRATVTAYRVRLERAAENARARYPEREGLLLTLEYDGSVGQGEAAPLPGYSPETLADARRALASFDAAELGDPGELGPSGLRALLERPEFAASPAARFALETALLDLGARRRGLPLHLWLRDHFGAGAPPTARAPIPLAALIDERERAGARERAEAALGAGYATLKLKIGRAGGFDEELAVVALLRQALGREGKLRLDANGGFDGGTARARLAELAAFEPEFVEEPVSAAAPPLLAPPVPIALDESLVSGFELGADDARARGLVALVLKPGLLGGLAHCWALTERARAAGLGVVISHAFEGPVGYAAAVELCLALTPERHAQGLAPHAALDPWGARLRSPGLAGAALAGHDRPGLGLPRADRALPP